MCQTAKAKKASAKKGVKGTRSKTSVSGIGIGDPTEEEIRIRAYFIAERRHRLGLHGNATSDWEEARRQLLAEKVPPLES